jgi:hypothetical protein
MFVEAKSWAAGEHKNCPTLNVARAVEVTNLRTLTARTQRYKLLLAESNIFGARLEAEESISAQFLHKEPRFCRFYRFYRHVESITYTVSMARLHSIPTRASKNSSALRPSSKRVRSP